MPCCLSRRSRTLEARFPTQPDHRIGPDRFGHAADEVCGAGPAAEHGTVPTELFVDGDRITVKYRATGNNNYADDHLVLRGDVMAGNDVAGQRVVYTKTSDTAAQTSLTSTTSSGQN